MGKGFLVGLEGLVGGISLIGMASGKVFLHLVTKAGFTSGLECVQVIILVEF